MGMARSFFNVILLNVMIIPDYLQMLFGRDKECHNLAKSAKQPFLSFVGFR